MSLESSGLKLILIKPRASMFQPLKDAVIDNSLVGSEAVKDTDGSLRFPTLVSE